ncbi:MAG: hypothetical protein R3C26_06830 [Calditrichia bacterium]
MRNNNMILLFNNSFSKLMLLTLVVGQLFGQNSDSVKIDGPMPTIADSLAADTMVVHKLDRVVKNRAFSVGEKLTFNIRYGIIKAGEEQWQLRKTTAHQRIARGIPDRFHCPIRIVF